MKVFDPRFLSIFRSEPIFRKDNQLYFIDAKEGGKYEHELKLGANRLKTLLKRFPRFYEALRVLLSPAVSCVQYLTSKKAAQKIFRGGDLKEKIIINIGSGVRIIHPEIINLDIYPFKNVNLVVDARNLPFKDNSIDMIICESTLEHISEAHRAIKEISRVVKSGGYVYVSVPFMYPFHVSPNDFSRWTKAGVRDSFKGFEEIASGAVGGPMAMLQGGLMHLLALPLSFGIRNLYLFWVNLFMVLLAPIKILDIFFNLFPQSHEVAANLYFLGKKK